MSHINTVKIQMTDRDAIMAAANHLGLTFIGEKTHELFNDQRATGLGFTLPGWSYPVVIDVAKGEAAYDNYNEHWGKQIELDKMVQRYGIEVARQQAELHGMMFNEETLANGDVRVNLTELVTA